MSDLSSPECVRHAMWIARGILERRAKDPSEHCPAELLILAEAAQKVIQEMTDIIPTAIERRTT